MSKEIKTQVVVLGAGPAGYSAAFRCADLGLETVLVERYSTLGGVCLNVGCIPSKALLHVAKVIEEAKHASKNGVYFAEPRIDLDEVRAGKEAVVAKLTGGLAGMAKQRKVTVVEGLAAFTDPHTLVARDRDGKPTTIKFDNAIIAAGSRPIQLPFIPHEDPRVWDSTDALKLKEVPKKLLIMGGGIIGLEMGTVYHALGSEVEVVEMFDQVIPAADKDVVAIYTKQIEKKFKLMLETKVTAVEAKDDGIYVSMEGKACNDTKRYDAVLVAIGRTPNGKLIDAGKVTVCSGTALSPSPDGLKRFYANIDEYRKKIILRPQEISNNPGIARRIGVIAMNTAIEFDIFGNVNSTHIMGSKMMNGVGGSGDFARSAYLTIFCTNSVAKNGDISSIVPYVSHVDHPEHDTMIFCTEQGVADCRGLSPVERARLIIEKCAHPDYKPMLTEYLEKALAATKNAHTPMLLDEALSWHKRFTETGSMKK